MGLRKKADHQNAQVELESEWFDNHKLPITYSIVSCIICYH